MKLESKRYEEIAKIACEVLMDYGINKFPIDVFELAKKMNIKTLKYSGLDFDERSVLLNGSDDGMSWKYNNQIYIAYNDLRIKTRIRFTIAHEIGHIVLGHTESNEENESEADFFARNLLVPPCIFLFNHIMDINVVSNKFDVSMQVALNALNALGNRIIYNHESLTDYEISLLKYLKLYWEDKT